VYAFKILVALGTLVCDVHLMISLCLTCMCIVHVFKFAGILGLPRMNLEGSIVGSIASPLCRCSLERDPENNADDSRGH